jgi:tripartite-type tricarboxylate transporter receptor subunit TctC
MNLKRRIRGWIGGLAAVALVPGGVAAEVMTVAPDAFPARPITLIVPFPAGGPSDALARAIAQGMSIHLKQPIVVENISGAGGTIGLAKLVKSARPICRNSSRMPAPTAPPPPTAAPVSARSRTLLA